MINLLHGDCLEQMKTLEDNSVDAIVSDPPYGISFMAKKWDYDVPSVEVWKEAMRVLKPGGHALIACGTRTQHRMVVNIEDAGFEIRDVVSWIYGCLSDDTELLIDGKWEPYHKAIDKGRALTYNIEKDTFQWEEIQELVTYDYKDTAYRIHSDNTDQIVSKNHRCIVERGGGKAFAYAETLERQENIPILEDLPRLLESLPVPNEGTGEQKQVVQGLPHEKHGTMEQGEEADQAGVHSLRNDVLPNGTEQEQTKESVQQGMQRSSSGGRVETACPQGTGSVDGGIREGACRKNDGRHESIVEGRSDLLQEEGELQGHQACEMPRGVHGDGKEGRVCDGTQACCGSSHREATDEDGGSASRESRPAGQQAGELGTICQQQGSQAIRASRHTTTDLANVEPIHYQGVVWCIRVPSGAFVARRNGKVFVTGNSGFPKSLNISKAIDKAAGAKREVVGVSNRNSVGKLGKKGSSINLCESSLNADGTTPLTAPATEAAKQWDGWGSALKPAVEFFTLCRKPLSESTIAKNVLKWGTGGINIDGCRVGTETITQTRTKMKTWRESEGRTDIPDSADNSQTQTQGRFPANLILTYPENEFKLIDNATESEIKKLNRWINENS